MFATDLAYVRYQLSLLSTSESREVAKKNKIHPKTLQRILSKETPAPRSDTIGKLAVHFKTIERRKL